MSSAFEGIGRRLREGRRGQATVEAAFALPVLMLLLLLLLQPGIVLYDRIVMEGAASEGCRLLATAQSASSQTCEDFIRRRLSAVPEADIFHVHRSGCSWDIQMTGGESASTVTVRISTKVQMLPLIGSAAMLVGAADQNGVLDVTVESSAPTQPEWASQALGGSAPGEWMGAWAA